MTTRFKLSPPDPLEQDIHEACAKALDLLLLPPAEWCCYPAGHIKLQPAEVARLARAGLKRAYPDLLIFHRQVWGFELKRLGGRLSKTRTVRTRRGAARILIGQEDMFPKLLATGAFGGIATCYSVDGMLGQAAVWGIPLRAGPWSRPIGRPYARVQKPAEPERRPSDTDDVDDLLSALA